MSERLLFIHHSTGGNLIHQGNLREKLYTKTHDVEFWDHGYNLYPSLPKAILSIIANKLTFHTGLSNEQGKMLYKDFQIKLSNNDPADFENIFCKASKTLDKILEFDIIAFKNCFPTTKIETEEKLQRYKQHYINMGQVFANYPEKIFIPFTPLPLRKEVTQQEYAQRAKDFAYWMVNEWVKPDNVKVFDFFSELADTHGYLKKDYCPLLPIDSHPNKLANINCASAFVDFLLKLA